METVQGTTQSQEPWFSFDSWQCPTCGNVMTDTSYSVIMHDAWCVCRQLHLSAYRFVKAKISRQQAKDA